MQQTRAHKELILTRSNHKNKSKKLRYNNLDKVLIRLKFDFNRIDSASGTTRIHLKRADSFILQEW